jgi:hypothetical protein
MPKICNPVAVCVWGRAESEKVNDLDVVEINGPFAHGVHEGLRRGATRSHKDAHSAAKWLQSFRWRD